MSKKEKETIEGLQREIRELKDALLFEKTMKERARQERSALSKVIYLLNHIHDKMVAENKARGLL